MASPAWARSRVTQPRPLRYEAGTLVGQHIDCVIIFAQFCEWLRLRIRSCSRDMERGVLMTGRGRGFCSTRSWLSACRRRVVVLVVRFPPIAGAEAASGADVVPRVQTTSVENAQNGPLWARWSAFSAIRRWSWCARVGWCSGG